MIDVPGLDQAWRAHGRLCPVHRRPILTDRGLLLGAETVLVPLKPDYFGRPCLALDRNEARLLALLEIAYARPFESWVIEALRPVAGAWRSGDPGLARLQLAYAGVPALARGEEAPRRLFIAAGLLDAGWKVGEVLTANEAANRATSRPGAPSCPAPW